MASWRGMINSNLVVSLMVVHMFAHSNNPLICPFAHLSSILLLHFHFISCLSEWVREWMSLIVIDSRAASVLLVCWLLAASGWMMAMKDSFSVNGSVSPTHIRSLARARPIDNKRDNWHPATYHTYRLLLRPNFRGRSHSGVIGKRVWKEELELCVYGGDGARMV